jgi:hypothetical protein
MKPLVHIFTRLLLCCAALTLLTQCAGYKVGPIKPQRLADVNTIAVPTVKNMTLEPRSSVLVTNEIIKKFQNDGTYKIATTDKADAILKGSIREVRRRQLRGARFNNIRTRELEVSVVIEYTLENTKTNVVLAQGSARGSSYLFLDPNHSLSVHQAVNAAAAEAANDLVSRLTESIPGQSGFGGSGRDLTSSGSRSY